MYITSMVHNVCNMYIRVLYIKFIRLCSYWYVFGTYLYIHTNTLFFGSVGDCSSRNSFVHWLKVHYTSYLPGQFTSLFVISTRLCLERLAPGGFWAWCQVCVRMPLLLSQTNGARNAGSGSITHVLPMLLTWSTAFVVRISTSCALMVR
jgi:hypothetical protein